MKAERIVKICGYAVLVAIFGGIFLFAPNFYGDLWRVVMSGNMKEVAAFINSFGTWALFFGFMLVFLVNIVGLPSIFVITANGLLFGPAIGSVISWLAEALGVIVGFFLMRTILRPSAEKLIKKSKYLKRIDEFSDENGFKLMLILRSLPYFPSGLLTALGAISHIKARDYAWASLWGKLPATVLEVVIGHDLFTINHNLGRLIAVLLISVLVYGAIYFFSRKGRKSR